MKDTNLVRIGCGVFLIYIAILIGALIHILSLHIEPSNWLEIKPLEKPKVNCDSLLQIQCDSLGIDYNTIGTTTDPD